MRHVTLPAHFLSRLLDHVMSRPNWRRRDPNRALSASSRTATLPFRKALPKLCKADHERDFDLAAKRVRRLAWLVRIYVGEILKRPCPGPPTASIAPSQQLARQRLPAFGDTDTFSGASTRLAPIRILRQTPPRIANAPMRSAPQWHFSPCHLKFPCVLKC
jgi:hypothetical protein